MLEKYKFPTKEEYLTKEQEMRDSDIDEFKSLSQGVEVLREIYSEEEERRNSLESKISGVLGINAILLAFSQVLASQGIESVTLLLLISPLGASSVICLFNMKPRKYLPPFNPEETFTFSQKDHSIFQKTRYVKYLISSSYNKKINTVRYRWLNVSFGLSALAILVIVAISLATTISLGV